MLFASLASSAGVHAFALKHPATQNTGHLPERHVAPAAQHDQQSMPQTRTDSAQAACVQPHDAGQCSAAHACCPGFAAVSLLQVRLHVLPNVSEIIPFMAVLHLRARAEDIFRPPRFNS